MNATPRHAFVGAGERARLCCAAALISVATLWVLAPVARYPFLPWDDGMYVFKNERVLRGLTLEGVRWAFTNLDAANWHPLTWISHMLDVQVFGLDPGAHHLSSLALHLAAALLLLAVLRRLTGMLWRSLLVSLLFAIHPLHVESVAWVAERKDVLSAVALFIALAAWLRFVRRPGWPAYTLGLVAFALGLMTKPMLVTFPLLLLLLDFWPLGRWRPAGPPATAACVDASQASVARRPWPRLLAEKAPFLALSAAAAVTALVAQARHSRVLIPLELIPPGERLANAAVSTASYLRDFVQPTELAFFYPFPIDGHPISAVVLSTLLLAGLTLLAIRERRRRPWIALGWGWYLAMLLPVAGIVQVGVQSRADRYTYLPLVGFSVGLIWTASGLLPRRAWRRPVLIAAGCLVTLVCAVLARRQVGYWHDTETLTRRALAVTTGNWVAAVKLASELQQQGREAESLRLYREVSLDIPAKARGRFQDAAALAREGRLREAAAACLLAAQIYPPYSDANFRLAQLEVRLGELPQAAEHLRAAIAFRPDFLEAHFQRGVLLAELGRWEEAAAHFAEVVRLNPEYPGARENLQILHEGLGHVPPPGAGPPSR